MKKIVLAALLSLGMSSMSVLADGDEYKGFSVNFGRSTQPSEKNISTGVTVMLSRRPNAYYGYEMQVDLFGNTGPFTKNGAVGVSAIGFVPLSNSRFTLYGKVGVADVYSTGSSETANKLGLMYGAGVEFPREVGIIRVGLQHFTLGSSTLSPSLSTNQIGLTLLIK